MKSLLIFLAALLFVAVAAQPKSIKTIRHTVGGIQIVDNRGRRSALVTVKNDSDIVGYNTKFCIVRSGSEYHFYDASGRRYNRVDTAEIGKIIAVTGETFSAGNDSIRTTFDADCKPLSSRIFMLPDTLTDTIVDNPVIAVEGENNGE